jgi:tetratricopeptide (TPR) repeat protein
MMEWRKDVIEFALDHETRLHMEEQLQWISREPQNPRPYYHLAQLYRMQWKQEEALGLLLESVRLDAGFAAAHVALSEIYAVREDHAAAWRHARAAERNGDAAAVDMLTRHGVPAP